MDPATLERKMREFIENSVKTFHPRGDKEQRKRAREALRVDLTEEADRYGC